MFYLTDGREHLYQWDLNRQITVEDPDVTEVHFCNRTDDCSLVVEVKNGVANIPNILLQETWNIRVYAYCNEYTKIEEVFKVKPRTKPADYVYTETEVLQYSNISERMTALEENIEEVVATEVNAYMEEHPVEVDLSNTAEKDHKHTLADITDYNEPDLSDYAKKDEIPTVPDVSNFITTTEADNKYAAKEDVEEFATESWVKNQGYISKIPDSYVTEAELNSKGYVSNADLSIYAKRSELPDTSDFLTSIPAEYVTESELDAKGYLTKHQSLSGYATEKYVDEAIANAQISGGSGGDIDLSNYVTEEELNDALANIDIPDGESGIFFIDEIAGTSNPATDAMIAAVNYYKEHGSVSVYVKPLSQGIGYAPTHFRAADDYTFYITTTPDVNRFGDSDGASMRCLTLKISSADNGATWTCERTIKLADLVTETELTNKGYQTADDVNALVNDVKEYAEDLFNGANKAISFNSYSDMITELNSAANDKYTVGQNIMIVTLNVPDLWVSAINETAQPYTYTSDADMTDALAANGSITVGHFVISALETQKVDLTNYATTDYVDEAISNIDIPDTATVKDVQISEKSVVDENGIATIPVVTATKGGTGLLTVGNTANGMIGVRNINGAVRLAYPEAVASGFKARKAQGSQYSGVVSSSNFDLAVKVAMTDGVGAAWTETEQAAARTRMGAVSSDDVNTAITNALAGIARAEGGSY